MRIYFTIIPLFLIFILSCQSNKKETLQEDNSHSFYVGTYTDGDSKGIYKYSLSADGMLQKVGLAAVSNNPSFLAKSANGKYLLAVNEISNNDTVGTVESYLIEGDSLTLINRRSSGGAHPCFVTTNKNDYVLTANYTGGNIGLLKINNQGTLTQLLDIQQHYGKGITERQEAPHAHSTWFTDNGTNIISVDLGTNELWFSQLDTLTDKLIPSGQRTLKMAPGDGPRHLAFHPNHKFIYVLNELNNMVTLVEKDSTGQYKTGISISMLPDNYSEKNKGADIHISSDGNFLYASNRGHNSIAIYQIDETNGSLKLLDHEATRGDAPRNFSLSPDENYLLVANQFTNNIISFKRDKVTGLLQFVDAIDAPTPVCILF